MTEPALPDTIHVPEVGPNRKWRRNSNDFNGNFWIPAPMRPARAADPSTNRGVSGRPQCAGQFRISLIEIADYSSRLGVGS
jgi:hypothetical protein